MTTLTWEDLALMEPWEWPQEAGKTLLAALSEPVLNEPERLQVIEMAGDPDVIDNALARKLLSLLGDATQTAEVRGQAAISLGPVLEECELDGFDEPDMQTISEGVFKEIRSTLHKLYDRQDVPETIRRRVLEAAVRAPQDWQEEAVRQAWAMSDPEWKASAVFGMGYVPGFDAEILSAIDSDDAEIKYWAIVAAGQRSVDEAWPQVVPLLSAPVRDKDLLMAAIATVGSMRPHEASMALGGLLDDKDDDVREHAREMVEMAQGIAGLQAEDQVIPQLHDDVCTDPSHHHGAPKQLPAVSTKVGRNEPCPCGSGKKYKKCCGQ